MPVAPGTDCACHGRRSCVLCSSPEPSGEYGRRSCPTSAGGCGSRSVTTTRERTRWRARASCSRPRPTVGYQGSVERTGLRPAPWSAFRPLSAGHGRQACCAGWHSFVRLLQTWWQRLDTMRARIVRSRRGARRPDRRGRGVGCPGAPCRQASGTGDPPPRAMSRVVLGTVSRSSSRERRCFEARRCVDDRDCRRRPRGPGATPPAGSPGRRGRRS